MKKSEINKLEEFRKAMSREDKNLANTGFRESMNLSSPRSNAANIHEQSELLYDQYSDEYVENGHYIVDGLVYMSLWTWRRTRGLPGVSHHENARIGDKIKPEICKLIYTVPDIPSYEKIKAYDVSFLDENPNNILEL